MYYPLGKFRNVRRICANCIISRQLFMAAYVVIHLLCRNIAQTMVL